jgi:hypothetical protein
MQDRQDSIFPNPMAATPWAVRWSTDDLTTRVLRFRDEDEEEEDGKKDSDEDDDNDGYSE